ncbi:hypothetical protein PENSPDRAFT_682149 [Peniophora sp. CONT]|nr:hypothetical protein PENSPDRAFT_682149 [Peniophora sp. CONT]
MTATLSPPSSHELAPDVKRHDLFYAESIVFEVQGTLFKVPRYGSPGNAASFEARFTPSHADRDAPGSSDTNPIHLGTDVIELDLTSFLKAAYPPPGQAQPELSLEEWMSVFKLAKIWSLADMRDRALSQAERVVSKKSSLEKILLGKKHGVVKWLKDGYKAIGCRTSGLTQEEKDGLDLVTRCGVLELRDRTWAWSVANYPYSSDAAAASCKATFDCDAVMLEIFGDELREV